MADFWRRMITQSVIVATVAKRRGCPVRQPSPKKSPFPWSATTAGRRGRFRFLYPEGQGQGLRRLRAGKGKKTF